MNAFDKTMLALSTGSAVLVVYLIFGQATGLTVLPPAPARADAGGYVRFVSEGDIHRECGEAIACTSRAWRTILVPNPCDFQFVESDRRPRNEGHYVDAQNYASVMCHELGHLNGWQHFGDWGLEKLLTEKGEATP